MKWHPSVVHPFPNNCRVTADARHKGEVMAEGLIAELSDAQRPGKDGDDERRRYYRLTPLGRKAAMAEVRRMAELLQQASANGLAATPR